MTSLLKRATIVVALLGCAFMVRGWTLASAADPCAAPVHAIACENTKPGSPEAEWDVPGSGDDSIKGFTTDISVDQGEQLRFKVKTDARDYRIDIYRVGYYNGDGARKVATVQPSAPLPQSQPSCLLEPTTLLIDCGNWAVSASWNVPADAVSGVYLANLVREDPDDGRKSQVIFVVRDDDGGSDVLFQTSDTTWHAYNDFGGISLYTTPQGGRAYKVSYNRPLDTRGGFGGAHESNFFNAEYPMIRWLERNGYDVSYFTGVDSDRRGAEILEHEVFLSVGHDEYWSAGQRANVEAARNAGVSLAFLSGNEVFWKTRWESSIDGSGAPYRTLVSYKETHANAKIDPDPAWTGTWRDPRFSPPSDGGKPENALTGTMFMVNCCDTTSLVVGSEYSALRFWRNTSVAALAPGQSETFPHGTLGYEWDEDVDNGFRPAGLLQLSSTTVNVSNRLLDYGSTYGPGTATHSLTLYRHASGALVFGAGTVQWSWGLDDNHDRCCMTTVPAMQQATVNLLADMGAQPATLQPGLVAATASVDVNPPVSAITSPANGSAVNAGAAVTISGTASDTGGVVGAVEVSTDGGATWHPASGRTSWSYTWIPGMQGQATILSRAVDDSGNMQPQPAGITVTVNPRVCPCSIWSDSTVPGLAAQSDGSGVELGLKFRASTDGYVTGVRFYKGPGNNGTHTGRLWKPDGTLLGTVTFTNETSGGWQQAMFSSPIAITANTTYIVSYHAPFGHFAHDQQYFATAGVDNHPLNALANGADGPNGVFRYGAAGSFPNQSVNASNYYVDVVFDNTGPDIWAPAIAARTPANGASKVPVDTNVTATFTEPIDAGAVSFSLRDGQNNDVPAAVSYDAATRTATLNPNADLAEATTYTATITGARDAAGNVMPATSWSFTTIGPATSIWDNTAMPGFIWGADGNPVELGVRFRSDVAGWITGVRFYKGTSNTGTHHGRLWTSDGTLLASATFTNETGSGWQEVTFPAPVAIAANTTYVASYFTPVGGFAHDMGFFANSGVDNAPLHALQDGIDGRNGVYVYASNGGFPTNSNASNYWVDVRFSPTFVDPIAPALVNESPTSGSTDVAATSNVTATFSEQVDAATISFVLRDGANNAIPAAVSYDPATRTATLDPNAPLALGVTYTATVSGTRDLAGNVMAPTSWSFSTRACPCTIFAPSAVPGFTWTADGNPVELGVKFKSEVAGYATGVRFYKGTTNTGTHVGNLWAADGTLLSSVAFTNETASGWQEASFPTPVPIAADTVYVASYFTPVGGFSHDQFFFSNNGVTNSPLTAPRSSDVGGNGVFRYGAGGGFPDQSVNHSNYWVDVVFDTTATDTSPPSVMNTTPADGANTVSVHTNVTARFNESIQPSTISFEVREAGNAVAGGVSYDGATRTATFDPTSPLALGRTYTATISARDLANNLMPAFSWSFSTPACPCSIWSASAAPGFIWAADNNPVELGVKFRAEVDGYITGIRFYKGSTNMGTHVGNLWTAGGSLLASATFTNETASGWQQADFTAPVPITAGTTYVASYYAPVGGFAHDQQYFAVSGVTNGPLTALQSGVDGGNGVFRYGAGGGFPDQSVNHSNYWVDVVFSGSAAGGGGGLPGVVSSTATPTPEPTPATDTSAPSILARSPAPRATGVPASANVSAVFSEDIQRESLSIALFDSHGRLVKATVTYDSATRTATLDPVFNLRRSTLYAVRVAGARDTAGNQMQPVQWWFRTR